MARPQGRVRQLEIGLQQVSKLGPSRLVGARVPRSSGKRSCLADGGYDSDPILEAARQRDLKPVIPSSKKRKRKRRLDPSLYERRYRVEVFFHSLKRFRRPATRYDKTAVCYLSFLHVVCTMLSL